MIGVRCPVKYLVLAQGDGTRCWTKSAPRFLATQSPGTVATVLPGRFLAGSAPVNGCVPGTAHVLKGANELIIYYRRLCKS